MPRRLRRSKRRDDEPLTTREFVLGTIGPSGAQAIRWTGDPDRAQELLEAWKSWNEESGLAWRDARNCPTVSDLERLDAGEIVGTGRVRSRRDCG